MKVEARALEVQAGDRLLLCSDGLTEMVSNDVIGVTLDADRPPRRLRKSCLSAPMKEPPAIILRWSLSGSMRSIPTQATVETG